MRIGIIGAGHIGQALATLGVTNGHHVMISNSRAPDTIAKIIAALGCLAGTAADAAAFGDVVVVTVPFKSVFQIDPTLLEGKLVIDTNNYYPDRDGRIAEIDEHRTTTSEMVAAHFRGSQVVKAFNAILAADLATDVIDVTKRRALPIAGDDASAKRIVARLHHDFGFETVDAGSLADSWRFERAKPAYCIPLDRIELQEALNRAERDVELPHGSWRRQ